MTAAPAAPVYAPPTPAEIFAEAISAVPIVHTPVTARRVLAIGQDAVAAGALAQRYPTFTEIVFMGAPVPAGKDTRTRSIKSASELPKDWQADLVVMAVPGVTEATLRTVRQLTGTRSVVAIAIERISRGPEARDLLRKTWRNVVPYREHLPEPALFFLASDTPIARQRPVPPSTRRLTDKYLPALFTLAKDEYRLLFGGAP